MLLQHGRRPDRYGRRLRNYRGSSPRIRKLLHRSSEVRDCNLQQHQLLRFRQGGRQADIPRQLYPLRRRSKVCGSGADQRHEGNQVPQRRKLHVQVRLVEIAEFIISRLLFVTPASVPGSVVQERNVVE